MSILRTSTIEPEGATTTLTLGASGDTVTSSADSLKVNTFKDAGGNTLFTSDGSGTLSSVNSALKGGLIFISSQTASDSASVEFTSNIDSSYREYVFYYTRINPATDSTTFNISFSSDSGSTYGLTKTSTNFYAWHKDNGTSSALDYQGGSDLADSTAVAQLAHSLGNDADQCSGGEFRLFNPSSTTYVKNFLARTQSCMGDGSGDYSTDTFVGGYIDTTSVVNAVRFAMGSGNFDGTIAMYGTG